MRLKCTNVPRVHQETLTCVAWTPSNEIFAASDDQTISVWTHEGECTNKCLVKLDSYATSMDWLPSVSKQAADIFVVTLSDGCFLIVSKSGRIERKVQAHQGAIVRAKWNYSGQAIVTAGEDGAVKLYSRNGQLRSTITRCKVPIYSVVWSPDDDQILYTRGKELIVKTIRVDTKQLQWKAHDGVVMMTDWNPVNDKIVSCGEDCKYKVWDGFGRSLFSSSPFEFVITSVSWCPNGDTFAVGSYNFLRLCDGTGWSYSREKPESGSLLDMKWSADGTNCAAAGGNGMLVIAQLVERQLEWKNIQATLTDETTIEVQDVYNETVENLEFRNRIIEMSMGHGHLIVTTAAQCYLYSINNWNTPHIFDLRYPVSLIIQSDRHFVMVDSLSGVHVYNYEGRQVSTPNFPGLRVETLNHRTISMSRDLIAILDPSNNKQVRVFDVASGRPRGKPVVHTQDILEVDLSHYARSTQKLLSIVDRNRDLYVCALNKKPVKIATMCDTSEWNDTSDMLSAVADGKLVTWLYPQAVYVDKTLMERMKVTADAEHLGKGPNIVSNFGARVTVRKADGALVAASISPYPPLLYEFVVNKRWEEAVRLCRFVKQDPLWAALAGMSLEGRHLDTAEIALAAISELDKLQYILWVKDIPSEEGRNAELMLYMRETEKAESILLQASPPLLYRAIKMNIRLFKWKRALELAVTNKTHVDTVLGYRQKYLQQTGKTERDPKFLQYGKMEIDWEAIKAKKQQEKEKEARRGKSSSGK